MPESGSKGMIIPKYNKQQITSLLNKRMKGISNAILLNLKRIGEEFVAHARDNDTYKDRTGNLRSSIGYVILYNGVQLASNFESRGGKQGLTVAKKMINDIKGNFPKGYVLIGVAGMDYAAAVESRGLDVITASSQQAEVSLRTAIQRIKLKAA